MSSVLAKRMPLRSAYFRLLKVFGCKIRRKLALRSSILFAKRMPLRSADLQFLNGFGRKIRRMSALRSGILFASTELMHRPRSDFHLHFDIRNIQQIRTEK